jgi:hypothetical protein
MKNTKHVHRTAKGKVVDMDMLRQRNELTPAVGNARVNARGDELGPGGEIVRKREDIVKEYYDSTVSAVPDEKFVPSNKAQADSAPEPEAPKTTRSRAQKKVEEVKPTAAELAEFDDIDDGWVEDDNGNFVKKGEV